MIKKTTTIACSAFLATSLLISSVSIFPLSAATPENMSVSSKNSDSKIDSETREKLCESAKKAAENAYAPYSHFRVGAALLTDDGQVFTGTNVENASYGLALCAERSALAKLISSTGADKRKIKAVAVSCIDAPKHGDVNLLMPCGACRQWLFELAPNATVYIADRPESFAVKELLPHAFSLKYEKDEGK